jgi:hypothetical protein
VDGDQATVLGALLFARDVQLSAVLDYEQP